MAKLQDSKVDFFLDGKAPCARAAQLDASTHGDTVVCGAGPQKAKLTSQHPDGSFSNPGPAAKNTELLSRRCWVLGRVLWCSF